MFMGVDHSLEPTVTDLGKTVKWGKFNLDSAESDRGRKLPGSVSGLAC